MKRKIITLGIAVCVLLSTTIAFAAGATKIEALVSGMKIYFNGKALKGDVLTAKGKTYLPMDILSSDLGFKLSADTKSKKFTISQLINVTALQNNNSTLQSENNDLKSASAAIQTERDSIKTERDSIKSENDNLKTERDTLKNGNDTLKTERDALKNGNDTLKTEKDALKNENDNLKTQLSNTKTNAQLQVDKLNADFKVQIDGLNAKHKTEIDNLNQKLAVYRGDTPSDATYTALKNLNFLSGNAITYNQYWSKAIPFKAGSKIYDADTIGIQFDEYKLSYAYWVYSYKLPYFHIDNRELNYTMFKFSYVVDDLEQLSNLKPGSTLVVVGYSKVLGNKVLLYKSILRDTNIKTEEVNIKGYEGIIFEVIPPHNDVVSFHSNNDVIDYTTIDSNGGNNVDVQIAKDHILIMNPQVK